MNKKLTTVLKEANKKLKEQKFFSNYHLIVDGDFTDEYNQIILTSPDGRHNFPVTYAETETEAIVAVNAYMVGLSHGKDNSYPKLCDRNNY